MTRKFLICGSRDWDNYAVMRFRMSNLSGKMTLIHGDAKGADRIAVDIWTRILKNASLAFPADWKQYGRRAGPIRNTLMLTDNPEIELVLAFSNDLSISKGTQDMVKKALKFKIPIEVIREETYYHIESI
ncbi:MAG: SLOG family protein [Nitrosopumilus sp.]